MHLYGIYATSHELTTRSIFMLLKGVLTQAAGAAWALVYCANPTTEVEMKATLTTEQILNGLKHYRRIARQDMLRAPETPQPEAFLKHAESRRAVYMRLAEQAEQGSAEDVIDHALELYRTLPFVTGTPEFEHPELRGQENALENFFLMVGLDPKVRREARSARPRLQPSGA